jgi:hypothetical protein
VSKPATVIRLMLQHQRQINAAEKAQSALVASSPAKKRFTKNRIALSFKGLNLGCERRRPHHASAISEGSAGQVHDAIVFEQSVLVVEPRLPKWVEAHQASGEIGSLKGHGIPRNATLQENIEAGMSGALTPGIVDSNNRVAPATPIIVENDRDRLIVETEPYLGCESVKKHMQARKLSAWAKAAISRIVV